MRNDSNTARKQFPPPGTDSGSATARFDLMAWMGLYHWLTPPVMGDIRATLRFGDESLKPDILLHIDEFHESNPEECLVLVADVASPTAGYDLGAKRELYRRFGVQEYIVWRVADRALDWFVLRNTFYWTLDPGPDGIIRSEVFPGLWLDPAALLRGDGARVLAVAQQGHGSPEHTAFVQELARRAGNPA